MPAIRSKIAPCLWFDTQAEEAARFYTSTFENSRIVRISRYGKAGHEVHGREAGTVLTVEFEIEGQLFVAINGGPNFKFSEAISFQIFCDTQEEIDRFWSKLTQGGAPRVCGWLTDKYGLSWQVVPSMLPQMIADADPDRCERVMTALLKMAKLDLSELQRAYAGE